MDFSFGIITDGCSNDRVNTIIDSIESQKITNYEVIIIGGFTSERVNTRVIPFDETVKPMWITKKKNLITENAKYDNVVYLHDYIRFEMGWYDGHLKSGDDFYVRMDKIVNYNGERFRDWCVWPHNNNEMDSIIGKNCLIPYDVLHLSKYQYISGSYWVAKKSVMMEFKLDETLKWGEGEDVLWSKQVRCRYPFNLNINSTVKILKPNKDRVFNEPNTLQIEKIKSII